MTEPSDTRRYLVLVQMGESSPQRLQMVVPRLQETLQRISTAGTEQLFRSITADYFGYLIRSKMNAHQIAAAIESPSPTIGRIVEPILDGKDRLSVHELGQDHASRWTTRALTWLQRH